MALTASRTLYRLPNVAPDAGAMLDALNTEQLTKLNADFHVVPETWLGVPALLVVAPMEREEAAWCEEVARTTGIELTERVRRTAALLLAVDEQVYAVGYDQGYRLIPEDLKDQRFGLSFAIRQVDPEHIRGFVSRSLGQARTDMALIPGGISVLALGIREHTQLIRRMGGYLTDINLTARNSRSELINAHGGCGLQISLGIEPGALVSDIREIARVCRERAPLPELEFVEHILPVKGKAILDALDQALDDVLGRPDAGGITVAVPSENLHDFAAAHSYHTKIGSSEAFRSDDFDLDYVLQRARLQASGHRLQALRDGTVTLYRDPRAKDSHQLAKIRTVKWIEANVSLGARHFCLLDGTWYEIGAACLKTIRSTLARLFPETPSVRLPEWTAGMTEGVYNDKVMDQPYARNYVSMDKAFANNPLKRTNRIELCDLLVDDDTFVLIKPAHGHSAPLSHLYNQGLVAIQMMRESADVRAEFRHKVFTKSNGKRVLPEDFSPRHLVFAIYLKRGTTLTPDTLFAFSQVTLAQTAKQLEQWGVTVEVIGIKEAEEGRGEASQPAAA
ncbi:TIGR04141 family sporadically distributed protein [Streptomyces sp. NBC_01474]|uniref:TIGR04141 family sporadically distributed protein n=1 Tax=Streptomyces sp. NBC_01474 TaxID=2903880 RepID=UPI002DD9253C|nr:TIGR04141 family sporadically distributed protein [Streptomyces sp. NBC_01474]WSD94927.1 TIGR04141 family sporadically distributed protein [Streptomyces sp. NBC_01474]